MSYVCDICEKKTVHGVSQQHQRGVAGKRWKKRAQATKRLFKPNLQAATVVVAGEKKGMKLCTKCIKRIKKYKAIGQYKNITLA